MARRASAGILVGDAGHDAQMLMLNAFEISPPLGRCVNRKPHALARDDVAAEKGQEARKLPVAGGLGDGAMEREILGDRALAAMQGVVDGAPGAADRGNLPARGARSAARAAASTSTASRRTPSPRGCGPRSPPWGQRYETVPPTDTAT